MGKSNNRYCPHCGSPHERYYSIETAAVMLDCSPQAVRNWVRDRKIGYQKFGRMVRIPAAEIERFGEYHPTLEETAAEMLIR